MVTTPIRNESLAQSLNSPKIDTYDAIICGGGLAGATLALQLKLKIPNISILVCDRLSGNLPDATFKVGESTLEVAAYYFAHTLQLKDYLDKNHLHKLGLRFFLGDSQGALQDRPEFGTAFFYEPTTYQLDRGVLERDLRRLNTEAGVNFLEACSIQDIEFSENEEFHTVVYRQGDTKESQTVKARWVIDAMGRRRFLQKKLGLALPNNENFSAAWFRIEERIDVSDLVPTAEEQWHNRVPGNNRYYSTNHLMGEGYWVWLIPLGSGHTSIGIVTWGDIHPFEQFQTYEKAYKWLEKHEPVLAAHLKERQPKDFMKMPKYSYSSSQVFSLNRWACVGEAGVFIDPLYSPGSDMIAIGNTLTTEMIRLDIEGKLTEKMVNYANSFFLTFNEQVATSIRGSYQLLGKSSLIFFNKLMWDACTIWAIFMPMSLSPVLVDPGIMGELQVFLVDFFALSKRVGQLFADWSTKSLNGGEFEFLDYSESLPFVKELRQRNIKFNKTPQELKDDYLTSFEVFEEFAQAIFLLAVEDTMPEKLAMFPSPVWLNAWAISLDPEQWERDGLFEPKSKPRDLKRVMEPLRKNIKKLTLAV
jgi:flavin-dependent dehydrogenase